MEEIFFHTPEHSRVESPRELMGKIDRGIQDADEGIVVTVDTIGMLKKVANDIFIGQNDRASEQLCALTGNVVELDEERQKLVAAKAQLKKSA